MAVARHRFIARTVTPPPLAPGFIGPGHLASPLLAHDDFAATDPFIMLMDDHLDIGDRPVGGPHPHAGFETVTLLLDGAIFDPDEGGELHAGEVQWMTAGRGIIHGENVATKGRVRLLQLWLTLPKSQRWTEPAFQDIHDAQVPVRRENGATVRVYSGTSGDRTSATRNPRPRPTGVMAEAAGIRTVARSELHLRDGVVAVAPSRRRGVAVVGHVYVPLRKLSSSRRKT